MKSTQFVCKETSATSQLDEIVVPTSRYSDSYGHADRESLFQKHGSFLENKASFTRSGVNEKDFCEVTGLMTPGSSSKGHKTCINIPKVDFSTFSPLLGTKFFCFHPCNFANVSDEIVTYLTHPSANVTFDLDEVNHVWKCQENVDFESATFTIALFEDSTKDKIFVKFHRLNGSCGVFSSSVERFSRLACLSSDLKQVNPSDLTETKVTAQTIMESTSRKRKGAFKALPLPLSMAQKSISCSEFVSYCEIFNLWSHSDIPECLGSLLSSMPKMWRDLLAFYEVVEKNPSSESMAELITMFASINKIYKNLCAIAVQSHNSIQCGVATVTSGLALTSLENEGTIARSGGSPVGRPSAVMIADTSAPADYMGHSHDPNSYSFLDYDDVDTSAGGADDHMYGMHAASNNHANRASVTVSQYRAMSVFDRAEFTAQRVDTVAGKAAVSVEHAAEGPTFEINLNAKASGALKQQAVGGNNDSMYSKLLGGASPSSQTTHESTPEFFQFSDLLSQQSKEDLSSILYLSVACIGQQFSCNADGAAGIEEPSFDMQHYLARLLQSNQEFVSVLQEISESRLPVDNSYGSFRSKDIKLYANQLNSILL